jgi:ATP-grasp domain-containing protein
VGVEVLNQKDSEASIPKILLTDTNRWSSPARLAIGLSKAGCRVSGVCPTRGHPLLFTRVVQQTFPYSSLRPLDSLTAAIVASTPQFIIPCDDRGVQHLHELFARAQSQGAAGAKLAGLIERSLGSSDSFPIVSSRYELLRIALEEGLRVPDTAPLKTIDDIEDWQRGHALPWVVKADGTFGGRGVKFAHSPKEAERIFREMKRPHPTLRVFKRLIVNRDPFWVRPWWKRTRPGLIIQSCIQGRPANCAVFSWKGNILAGIGVEVISSEGRTGPATVVRVVENSEMMLAAQKIARRLRLTGFFGLDFMIEEGSGASYLIEMNPRCTPPSHLQLGKGRDLVGALRAELTGQPFLETPPVTQNNMIVYFPQAATCRSELLASSFVDIPFEEPDLIQELLRPWPDRSLLYRLMSKAPFQTKQSLDSEVY